MKKILLLSLSAVISVATVTAVCAMPDKALPPASEPAAQSAAESLSGKVLQTMDSGGYTYIYIEKKGGEKVWVACTTTNVSVGSQVVFKGGMEMANFESKTLKRKFDKIIFADGVISGADTKAAVPENAKGISGGSKAAASVKDGKISVAKATGANAYTVKELYSGSGKLNKKKVVVSGKVVKVSSGIMNKNWIHIQDGTGSQDKKNHNLVCTSSDMADVGDVVTVTGVLAKDKDFGGGYKYPVILEDASIKK